MASTAPEGKKGTPVAVIAGGAGFLGSHLAEILLAQGQKVVVLDNYATGKEDNLKTVLGHRDFVFKIGDLNKTLPELPRVDYIFHLAGVEEYINGTDVSVETLLVNSIGTKNLLDLARQHQAKILLASSLDVYSGLLSSLSLESYFGINKRDEERFSHHEAKRYAEALTTEYFKKFGVDARIVRLADVYGPRMDLRAGTEIAALLAESLQPDARTLTVHGDGLKILHPTYISDVVYGLVKAAVHEDSAGKIYNLVNPEEQTVLSFASRLRKVSPHHPEMKFVDDIEETRFARHPVDLEVSQKELGWRPVIGVEEGLRRTVTYFKTSHLVPEVPHVPVGSPSVIPAPVAKEFNRELQQFSALTRSKEIIKFILTARPHYRPSGGPSTRRIKTKVALATALVFIFISVLVPLGGVLVHSGYGAWRLKGSQSALVAGQADSAFAAASDAAAAFSAGASELNDLTWLVSFLGARGAIENYRHLILAAGEVSSSAEALANSMSPLLKVGKELVATDVTAKLSPDQTNKDLSEARNNLEVADDHLAAAAAELKQVAPDSLPFFVQSQFKDVSAKVADSRDAIAKTRAATKVLPEIIGLNGSRNYLLLFLNNTELRPGGGFIGSYGIARFEDGRLRDLFVDDVYNPDGQLKNAPPAPQPLRDYLGVPTLGIRDSNWSPDFPTSSKVAKDLLYQATKRQVDGVIALDIKTIENLLRVVGPVSLADYGETVTADNFYQRTQVHAEVGFFPGSTAKKDFIGAVARIVLDKILHSRSEDWPKFVEALQTSLSEKHLQIASSSSDIEELLAESGWDGAIAETGTIGADRSGKVEDYLDIVDANIGGNKANYFVKNQANYRVAADKNGALSAELTLLYEHTATTETWPSGRYKDYLRVYAPKGAVLTKVEVSDVKDVPQVTTSEENGKTVFGFFFEVPSQTKRTIILDYSLPLKLPTIAKESSYHLLVQKQAGTDSPPFSFNFDAPTFLRVTPSGGTNLSPYSARFNSDLRTDRDFSLTVAP